MDPARKGSLFFGAALIIVGAFLLIFSLIPGLGLGQGWPAIFYLLAAGFCIPAFIWPEARRGLAGLWIPGSILFFLGLLFTYNVITQDWKSWAFSWLLIPTGVGFGLLMAAMIGGWGRPAYLTGLWIMAADAGLFALFATLFGSRSIQIAGAGFLVLVGALMLLLSKRTSS